MPTTRIVLAMLGALATSVVLKGRPKELSAVPAPFTAPTGATLLAPDQRLAEVSLASEYAFAPTSGWRRIVAPPIPDWAGLPSGAFSDLGPLGGTPVLEFGAASPAKSDDENSVERHPAPDEGPITHSAFDDEDRVDHHPVP